MQADLSIPCINTFSEGTFSHVAAQVFSLKDVDEKIQNTQQTLKKSHPLNACPSLSKSFLS